jgi:ElaB/YqjD/DUF883 family membrane-anchored ribosome-binding protein
MRQAGFGNYPVPGFSIGVPIRRPGRHSEAVLRHDREAMTGSQKHWMTGAVMATDALVSQELKSLREELSVSRKERAAASAAAVTAPATVLEPAAETREEKELLDQIHEFADEIKTLFDEAEKSVSAHPAQSVVGALLVGILIGRLLGRR